MAEISGNNAYLSGENILTTIGHGATPYIPFKSNSTAGMTNSTYGAKSALWTRMFRFYNLHREEFLQHYHKPTNNWAYEAKPSLRRYGEARSYEARSYEAT